MSADKFDQSLRDAILLDIKSHQAVGKKNDNRLPFLEALKLLEGFPDHVSIEKLDEMIQARIDKTRKAYEDNKNSLDIYYSELEIYALRRYRDKIFQYFGSQNFN